jgi:hypothetical protein
MVHPVVETPRYHITCRGIQVSRRDAQPTNLSGDCSGTDKYSHFMMSKRSGHGRHGALVLPSLMLSVGTRISAKADLGSSAILRLRYI